jgi:hypothetical protein
MNENDPYPYGLVEAISDIFNNSPLSPKMNSWLIKELTEHYKNTVLLITISDDEMRELVYSSVGENKKYAVLGFSYPEKGYVYIVLEDKDLRPKHIFKELLNKYKNEGDYSSLEEMGRFITEELNKFTLSILQLLEDSVRSRRQRSGTGEDEYDFPAENILQEFYECGRKVFYLSEKEALQHTNHSDDNAYKCSWGDHYHIGRSPIFEEIPHDIKVGRWRTAWRRHAGKREPKE